MAIPPAPADQSGGFMVCQYSNGVDTHRQRLHVLPFSLTSFISGGVASINDDGHHDYAFTTSRPSGSELGVTDCFAAWANIWKNFYHSDWVYSLAALYQIQNGQAVEIFPTPTPSTVAGVGTNPSTTAPQRELETIYSFRTLGGARARIILIGQSVTPFGVPATVTTASGLGASEQGLISYVSGANTAIVGHDGQKLSGSAHVTFAFNRRLRRHYGHA